jgi:trk system potassium uptake protein TrkA
MFWKKNNQPKNVLILGLGGVGFYLAKRLFHEGYKITVIETDSDLIGYADGYIDGRLIKGDAMNIECWREADVESMDFLIAVTDNDAVNMLSSMIADRFGIQRKIARVRSPDFGSAGSILNSEDLKIDLIIHPEELVAQEIVRLIKRTAGNEIIDIGQGQMQVMATRIHETSPLAFKKLKEISQMYKDLPFRVVSVARGINTIIPDGEYEILPQDQVLIMAGNEDLSQLMDLMEVKQHRRHGVMILGGGLVGSRVAELLGKTVEVRLIERDISRAEDLSYRLENAEILHGDGGDEDVLALAGLADMDTFVTTTGENQINIMSCLLAKHLMNKQGRHKQGKTIAMVKEEYLVLAATIGTDIALNKKILAGNEIMKFIRRGELLSVAHIHGLDTEVVELVAAPNSPITRAPLSKLASSFYGKILIGGVFRNGKWETAVGDTHIRESERVIGVCTSLHLKDIQGLFLSN